jgi:succinate dehydrogenase/fumarate reductase iron-sulfur protein
VIEEMWNITFNIARKTDEKARFFHTFQVKVAPDEYVLDGIEKIWAFQDRSLTFRHACHHSTCGACGMLVNGVEKLTCITPIRSVTKNGGTLTIEPLRNFPVIGDLVVDMSSFYKHMEEMEAQQVVPLAHSFLPHEIKWDGLPLESYERLVDCIECGLCVSACPSSITSSDYFGPAALAGAHQGIVQGKDTSGLTRVDHQNGLWRCHSAYECTAVCPSFVDPSFRIMDLRKKTIRVKFNKFFKKS